jgi:hypothetical protein
VAKEVGHHHLPSFYGVITSAMPQNPSLRYIREKVIEEEG